MTYIVQFTTSEQFTEDSWKQVTPTLEVNDHTTIRDIREWMRKRGGGRITEFKVITTETIEQQ